MRLWRRSREQSFLDREFIVATTDHGLGTGKRVLDEGLVIGFVATETTDGHPVLPVFTSERRLVEWMPQGSPWIGLEGRTMLAMFLQGEWEAVVIDPTKADGMEVTREHAEQMIASDY